MFAQAEMAVSEKLAGILPKEMAWERLAGARPLVIAGPCSAESEAQVLATARGVKAAGAHYLRAGIWKPRTRPGSFEGVGEAGLAWLRSATAETGLPAMVEVANPRHVELALNAGIDALWLGARTVANPFAVQEVADALRGVDIPVLVKNPVNPDTSLWLGAIERLADSGIGRLAAVLRGVSQFGHNVYRNRPEWQMAIDLRQHAPHLLFICDPSHIAGQRELVASVAQMALDLKFDGLMIETHIAPDEALSDSRQQLSPTMLSQLLPKLIVRDETPIGVELQSMEDMRSAIDQVDAQLMEMLAYRMKVVDDIARFKRQHRMTIFQEARWNELMDMHLRKSEEMGLSEEFIIALFRAIHQESMQRQTGILGARD